MSYKKDCELLGLDPSLQHSEQEIKAAFTHLALHLHPDIAGADPAEFKAVQQAYKRLREQVTRPAVCDKCGGTGEIPTVSGWYVLTENCPKCS